MMKPDEVLSVKRQYSAIVGTGKIEDIFVRRSHPGFARFLNGYDVVSETSQLFDDGQWEVLICVQSGH